MVQQHVIKFQELLEKQGIKENKVKEREWQYGNSKVTSYAVKPKVNTSFGFRTAESFLNSIVAKPVTTDLSQYKTGQTIYHKKFGEGIITAISPEDDDLKLDINFEKVGHKRLMAKYANLEIRA